jgi:hypothetical protein
MSRAVEEIRKLADVNLQQQPAQDIKWQDKQFAFNGSWVPDADPSLIGGENFAVLTNFRYNDVSIEGVAGYSRINNINTIDNGSTYLKIRAGHQLRTDRTTRSFVLAQALDTSGQGRVFLNTTAIDVAGDFKTGAGYNLDTNGNAYHADASSGLTGRFSDAPQQSICYCNAEESLIFSGDEQRIAAAFLVTGVPTLTDAKAPKDVTEHLNSSLSTGSTDQVTFGGATYNKLLFMTTRPIQGFKVYIATGGEATDLNGVMTVKTWTGSTWSGDALGTDGTIADGQTMRNTGGAGYAVTLDAHKNGTSVLMHYQELYLFAYLIESDQNLDAVIYQLTCDPAMQPIQNVWDGVYRQPIQFQQYDDSAGKAYKDYTLYVNQSSDTSSPIGAELQGLTSSDHIIIMFEERVAAIRFTMLGKKVNTTDATATVKYYDGVTGADGYADTSATDGTANADTDTFAKTGIMSWDADSITDEQPQTLFGSVGYAYKISVDATLAAGSGSSVLVDLCSGIPSPKPVKAFSFSAMYQSRLMLGGFDAGGEGNRMDYCVTNAPDVWNGTQSSMDGLQSLYFGGVESITGATQLYNRFGASVFSMLLVFKDTELYLLTGSTPNDFTIYPVSNTVGCPAPQTICTAEVGFEVGQGLTRNVAIWMSHYGPMMFDGAIIKPITGVGNYFDPNEAEYINWDYIHLARAWVDTRYKEYNLLIPSGTTATTNNIWLVYDLMRKKWFRKDTGADEMPQTAWSVMDTTGEQMNYGGIDTGFMVKLEDGTSWNTTKSSGTDGTGIEQIVKSGDFFPSDNIWDFCILRKLKILCRKLPAASSATTLQITEWGNASESGSNVVWQDSDAAAGINVDFTNMDVDSNSVLETEWVSAASGTIDLSLNIGQTRIIRLIQDLNTQGWVHAYEFAVTTTDAVKGWQPLFWGVQFYVSRKDNKATQ